MILTLIDCRATEMIGTIASALGIIHHYIPFQKCTYHVALPLFQKKQFLLGSDDTIVAIRNLSSGVIPQSNVKISKSDTESLKIPQWTVVTTTNGRHNYILN